MEIVQRALRNLLSFQVFDDTSSLHDIYNRVAQVFGMKPLDAIERLNTKETIDGKMAAVEEEEITPQIQDMLEKHTRLDSIVYRLALDHLRRTSRRLNS
jgi:hypothetical protein